MNLYQIIYKPGRKIFLRWLTEKQVDNLENCFDNIQIREVVRGNERTG